MPFPALENYLNRLAHATQARTRVWLDATGRAQGRYFNCTLTSVFQPIRVLDSSDIAGYEAFVRSYSDKGMGLSLWKLLDHAANDDESIELDRLCRMLHAINFYRQPDAEHADLFVSVHDRLLTAVSGNHGIAFRRILEGLGLPIQRIVLQLPAVTDNQGWLLTYVADNYRRSGFRFAVNAADATEALALLDRVRPDAIKVEARKIVDVAATEKLLAEAKNLGIRIIFKRLENAKTLETLRQLGISAKQPIYAQGYLWDHPQPLLVLSNRVGLPLPAANYNSGGSVSA